MSFSFPQKIEYFYICGSISRVIRPAYFHFPKTGSKNLILLPGAAVSGRGLWWECGCECDVDEVLVGEGHPRPNDVHVVVVGGPSWGRQGEGRGQGRLVQGVGDGVARLDVSSSSH